MVDNIFGNEDVSKFYPKGQWLIEMDGKSKKYDSSDLRPDTILIRESNGFKNVYILDSKFYRFGITCNSQDLPATSSIQKQIAYGDFIKANTNGENVKVYNAFILPFDKESSRFKSTDDLVYIGYAKINSDKEKSDYEYVHTFLIDLKHVIDKWSSKSHENDVRKLIEGIDVAVNNV